jgi:hypothetical protein
MAALSASPFNSVNQQQAQLARELGSPSVGPAQSSVFSSPADSLNSPFSGLYGIGLGGNRDIATDVYRAFRDAGFSDQQSQALTAEVNRENSLRPELLFGSHTDPVNEARNVGMLSFQGDRAPAVLGFLRERGLADEAGNITPGYASLQAQAEFILQEMQTDPSYARTRTQFLSNPNVDPETAHRVLGDNYIRWRRNDPEFRASGYNRIGEGYGLLTGQEVDANTTRNLRPVARPEREDQAENKSFLDNLPSCSGIHGPCWGGSSSGHSSATGPRDPAPARQPA